MKSRSIRSRLFFAYSVLIFMIIFTVVITIALVFSNYLIRNSRQAVEKRLTDIEYQLQEDIYSIVNICDEIKKEREVERLFSSNSVEDGWNESYNSLFDIHRQIIDSNYVISRILLINRDLEILDPVYERVLFREAIFNSKGFTEFLSGDYFYHFSMPGTFPIDLSGSPQNDRMTIVLYQKLLDENYWLMGYLLAVLRKDTLFDSIWANNQDHLFAGISVYSRNNELVYAEGQSFSDNLDINFGEVGKSDWVNMDMTLDDGSVERFLVLIKPVSGVNWYLTGFVPFSSILSELKTVISLLVIIGIVFIAAAFTFSYFLAGTITRPLFMITTAMHAYDESLVLEPIKVDAEGELKYLAEVYNRLVASINRYIANIYEEQEKKKEAELLSLQHELDFLQAQINPHFIHNTLNAIGYQAEKAGNIDVYESLKSFNILLRASISGTQDLISLEQELSLIDNFIRILRLRYGSEFLLEKDIDEDLKQLEVPKLILQPVVENSLFHGIEPAGKEGVIRIIAERNGNDAVISVKDNGKGMDTAEVEDILDRSNINRHFNRIGLKNVDDRIKILFGSDYGLAVISETGSGTEVRINIPLKSGDIK